MMTEMLEGDDHRWTIAALSVVAVLVAADLVLGPDVQFTGSVVIAPFLAAAMVGPQTTLAIVLVTVGAAFLLGLTNDSATPEFLLRLLVVTGGGGLAIWLADRRERRERDLADVTRVAEVAQRCVLTTVPSRVGDVAFASRYQSASPVALIGGDFYEVVECEGGVVRAVVGDVRGKGLDAVRLAAVLLGAFREAAQSVEGLDGVASLLDQRLRRHLEAEDFVTAVFAEFGPDGILKLVNCGHHPPLVVRSTGLELLSPTCTTTPLGLDPLPFVDVARLHPGDRLLLYTDGLVEARSQSGRMVSLDRLADTLRSPDLDRALERLVDALQAMVIGPLEDDLALILAEYLGPGSARPSSDPDLSSVFTTPTS